MKKFHLFLLVLIALLVFDCEKEEVPLISEPISENPTDNDPPVDDIDSTYVILEGSLGHWHASTILSKDGNVIIVGDDRRGNHRMKIIKTNSEGDVIFETSLHQSKGKALAVSEDSQKNIYIAGSVSDDNWYDEKQLAVAKLDEFGEVLWEYKYQENYSILGRGVAIKGDNEIVISGSIDDESNLVLLRIDSLGNEIDFKVIPAEGRYRTPSSILALRNGNILTTDYGDSKFNLTWFNDDLEIIREFSYGDGHRVCRAAIELEDGSIVAVGKQVHTKGNTNIIDSSKVLIVKINSAGQLLWEKEAGDTSYLNDGQSIAVNADGSFVINGYANAIDLAYTDHMLIYLDEEGNEINSHYFTDNNTFRGENIIKLRNGRNIMTGGYKLGIYFLNVDNYGRRD